MTADDVIKEAEKAEKEAEASAKDHTDKAEAAAKAKDKQTEADENQLAKGAKERATAAKKAKAAAQKSKNNNDPKAAAKELAEATSELDKATIRDRIRAGFAKETNKELDEKVLELTEHAKNWLTANKGKSIKNWPEDACRRKAGANLAKMGVNDPKPPTKQDEMTKFLKELVEVEGGL